MNQILSKSLLVNRLFREIHIIFISHSIGLTDLSDPKIAGHGLLLLRLFHVTSVDLSPGCY